MTSKPACGHEDISVDSKDLPPILQEDIGQLLNVAFAEGFVGYERETTPLGPRWIVPNGDGETCQLEDLPPVAGTQFALAEFLDAFCERANSNAPAGFKVLWSINLRYDGDYACGIVEHAQGDEATPPRQVVKAVTFSDDPAVAIAMTMVKLADFSLTEMHRALFPHRYLKISD